MQTHNSSYRNIENALSLEDALKRLFVHSAVDWIVALRTCEGVATFHASRLIPGARHIFRDAALASHSTLRQLLDKIRLELVRSKKSTRSLGNSQLWLHSHRAGGLARRRRSGTYNRLEISACAGYRSNIMLFIVSRASFSELLDV